MTQKDIPWRETSSSPTIIKIFQTFSRCSELRRNRKVTPIRTSGILNAAVRSEGNVSSGTHYVKPVALFIVAKRWKQP